MPMLLYVLGALAAQPSPTFVTHDLWRAYPGSDKVFVEVGLPDGSKGLFLLDTGAAVSVVNDDAAKRLGLESTSDGGRVAGLSGSVPWHRATLPSVDFGQGFVVDNIEVAVGVPGVPQAAGAIPVDGILGHNVWSKFVLVVDYPADRVELHRPGTYKARGKGQRVQVSENRVVLDIGITAARGEERLEAPVAIEIDTGAAETSLWCQTGEPFRAVSSLGVEPVVGIGAALDRVPDFQFLTETRRIPASEILVAGRKLKRAEPIRWSSPDDPGADVCGVSRGLLGFRPLGDWRVVLDYPGQKLVLEPPRKRRVFDAAKAWLAADAAVDPLGTSHPGVRAKVLVQHGDEAEARALVLRALQDRGAQPDLVVLASRIDRYDGEDAAAIDRLSGLSPVELVEEGAWASSSAGSWRSAGCRRRCNGPRRRWRSPSRTRRCARSSSWGFQMPSSRRAARWRPNVRSMMRSRWTAAAAGSSSAGPWSPSKRAIVTAPSPPCATCSTCTPSGGRRCGSMRPRSSRRTGSPSATTWPVPWGACTRGRSRSTSWAPRW